MGSHPGSALQPLATGKESAGDKANPCPRDTQRQHCRVQGARPTSQLLSEDAVLRVDTQSPGSWSKLSTETSQEPSVLIYHHHHHFFSFSCCSKGVCSTCSGPTVSCHSCSAPRAVGRGRFSLRGAFGFHDHTNCNKLYKETLASPKVWQQPFSVWAEGRRLCHPLLLHHTCPSASSPPAPALLGPFPHAAFSAAFPTPVLLAASCQTANQTH